MCKIIQYLQNILKYLLINSNILKKTQSHLHLFSSNIPVKYIPEFCLSWLVAETVYRAKYRQEWFRRSESMYYTFAVSHDKSNGYGNLVR